MRIGIASFEYCPLTLRGQYSKLAIPIRNFFSFAKEKGVEIHVMGQEKTGAFVDHLGIIGRHAPLPTILSHKHECALVPVELANGVVSLSSYPSAAILKVFADLYKMCT